jgi:hypothetical protein
MNVPTNANEFLLYFIPGFIGLWVFISLFLSFLGGWQVLGQACRAQDKIEGHRWRGQSGSTRFGVSYNRCLNITANSIGIGISISLLFRIGHPPLFIPWTDITLREEKFLFFWKNLRFNFTKAPNIPFRISMKLGKKIQAVAGETRLMT